MASCAWPARKRAGGSPGTSHRSFPGSSRRDGGEPLSFFQALFGLLLSQGGLVVLAALDSSVVFFLPLAVDMAVVYLAADDPGFFWVPPLLATLGSCAGATVTYLVASTIGDKGLERLLSRSRMERFRKSIDEGRTVALAVPALIPPPFPFTAFLLVSGALGVGLKRYLPLLAAMRLVRFGLEAALGALYGDRVLAVMRSEGFQFVIGALAVLAVAGTVWSAWRLWTGRG